jgi:membrane protease subunit (stomatin/prohibitin family)
MPANLSVLSSNKGEMIMGKFVITCPNCGMVHQASNSLFAKKELKKIHCRCGKEIDVKKDKLIARVCPDCGNTFFYDQSKGKDAKCPVCGHNIEDALRRRQAEKKVPIVPINCPQCACAVEVEENETVHKCPLCDHMIDVQLALNKAKLVNTTGISVIQYEGDNSTFVWKHPVEDFNMGSQLIVHESQEAVFFMNGQALDLFGPGRHTLETQNIPVLKQVYKIPAGSQTPFHAEVYFINKTVQMGLKWGTDSRVRFIDPATGIPLDIGAAGEMSLQVSDARRLLVKLVGTTGGISNKDVLTTKAVMRDGQLQANQSIQKSLQSYFRTPIMTEVKSFLATTIKQQQIDIMAIDEHMASLSQALRDRIAPKLEEYGVTIPMFNITYISLPEDDPNFRKLREMRTASYLNVKEQEIAARVAEAEQRTKILQAQTAAQVKAIQAQGDAEITRAQGLAEADVMRAKGYTQKDVLEADVQKAYAAGIGQLGSNAGGTGGNGGGNFMTDMLGMAAGMKMANTVFEKMEFPGMGQQSAPVAAAPVAPAANSWTCECGEGGNVGKFCMSCGKPKPEAWDCPTCGHTGNKGKFCEECGAPKRTSWDCACGQKGNTGKCCPECGSKRPE